MSDPNPAGGSTPSKPTGVPAGGSTPSKSTGVPAASPPQPKKTPYKVASKHDWCVVTAANEGEARQKWHEFFGIKGSDHEVEVTMTSEKPGSHSGQKTADVKILIGVAA